MNTENFVNLTFNTFDKENILLNDSFDPDCTFFNKHRFTDTTYFTPETSKAMIKETNNISFSVLQPNIRSLNKIFQRLKNLLGEINSCLKVLCITESWCSNDLQTNNKYQLPNYVGKLFWQISQKNRNQDNISSW